MKIDSILYYLSSSADETNVRYIGISSKPALFRLKKHIADAPTKNTYKDKWIRKEQRLGNSIKITVIANCLDYEIAKNLEIIYIKEAKEVGFKLVNTTLGGDGCMGKKSKSHCIKIGIGNKGKKVSLEARGKMSKAHSGKVLSPLHREKVIAILRTAKYTDARKEKLRVKATGRRHTKESKEKLRIASTGRIKSKAEIEKWCEKRYTPIVQLNKSGEFIKYFKSAKFAQEELSIDRSFILQVCRQGKSRIHAGGYKWMYYEKYKLTTNAIRNIIS